MRTFAIILALVLAEGYAVLAHEAIVDSVWDVHIRPLLLKRFAGAALEQTKEATATRSA